MIVCAKFKNERTGLTMTRALVIAPEEPAGLAWDEIEAATEFPASVADDVARSLDPRWGARPIPRPKKGP